MSHIGRRRLALSVPIVSLPASLSVIAARSLSGVLLSAALVSASLSLSASPCLAQDAFGWGPGDGAVDTFSTGGYGYPATTVEGENYGDSFSSPGDSFTSGCSLQPLPLAPTLHGMTWGRVDPLDLESQGMVRLPRKEYENLVTLPSPRSLLGASSSDLTTREVAGEDEVAPPIFPPMPKSITLPSYVSPQKSYIVQSDEFSYSGMREAGWNLGSTAHMVRHGFVDGKPVDISVMQDVIIDKALLERIMSVNELCSNNEDYQCRVGALGMQMLHEFSIPELKFAFTDESNGEIRELKRTLAFRESIAKIPASNLSASARSNLAASLEKRNKPYVALVERLRVVEMANDGPSRYYLAKLYGKIGEKKLAFETLREAVESSWGPKDRALLGQTHALLGAMLLDASRNASRSNHPELALLRLKIASIECKKALIINPNNQQAQQDMLKIAKQAVTSEPSFDNNLYLAGAYLLNGDLDRAQYSYDQCAEISAGDPRLKQARSLVKYVQSTQLANAAKPKTHLADWQGDAK